MNITLQNEYLTAAFSDVGAQMCSVKNTAGTEYIWQADPAVWGRHAPTLFPVIGRLKEQQYTLEDNTWTIPSHGFARDIIFTVTEQSETRVVFRLTENETTRSMYPFAFLFTITYELTGNQLKKICTVENRDTRDMPFELGSHDGFCIPDGKMDRYSITLDGVDAITPYGMDETCLITPKGETLPMPNGIPVKPMTYGLDTFILDSPASHTAHLRNENGDAVVTLEFPDYDYLGLWTTHKPFDTNYVCIEPWTTLPDATFVGRALSDKQGIRILAPGQSETFVYITTFH